MNNTPHRPTDLFNSKQHINKYPSLNNKMKNRRLPSQIKQNTGPIIKNKTNINRLF